MQSLLSPIRQPEQRERPPRARPDKLAGSGLPVEFLEKPLPILDELREVLQDNGISADLSEIARILMDGLAARPALCRGLLAAYLLNEK